MKLVYLLSLIFIISSCTTADQKAMKGYSSSMQATLRSHWPALQKCYSLQKVKEPQEESRVFLDFTILKEGNTSEVTAYGENFKLENDVEKCLVKEIQNIQFDPHPIGGSSKVHQPGYFKN